MANGRRVTERVARVLRRKGGILLDVSLGGTPQTNAVVMSTDLRHDARRIPFPLPDGCVHTAVVSHVLEYLDPASVFAWFDELHRVMRARGTVMLSGPYGGDGSAGWLTDPAHKTRITEMSFAWLDPGTPVYQLNRDVGRADPRPWRVVSAHRRPANVGMAYEVQLQTRSGATR